MDVSALESRRKKLYFRSCHRGIKEMDIIFSAFAQTYLPTLPDDLLDDYERILAFSDTDLFSWITGAGTAAPEEDFALLHKFLSLSYIDDARISLALHDA